MILISHRGNINGVNSNLENNPQYINEALKNYNVEVDVWWVDNGLYLGHDSPQYLITEEYLCNDKIWSHAKNLDALIIMLKNPKIHCFWHENDKVTLTSKNYLWTFPGVKGIKNNISVLPEIYNDNTINSIGICSDYISKYI